ncbi:hypothetical protein M9H77_29986 [Catharanthus roseus]|uniref:Uncharacterized protein n=1 Tax=Catharanthus roseus TaxID=4058 RepID=A0ACB9ZXY0_CATRO|nr:hypothetical protein M9H77_29986 [Catharanthus roseus]
MLGSVTLDLDPVDEGRSTVGGLGTRRLGQEGPTGWGSTGRPGRYAKVEKSNVRTLCFGVQAGIDYGMPEFVPMTPFKVSNSVLWVTQRRRCVLIRSDFPAAPKPFR